MSRRIVIVGNGKVGEGGAEIIDAADFVIRFNDCRSFGLGGTRTDAVAVCNTGRPAKAMLGSGNWRAHPAIVDASEIWSVRDPEKFATMRAPLAASHPELDDFCDDYTRLFGDFCAGAGKIHRTVGQRIHDAIDRALAMLEPAPYVVPSSGIIVIGEVLDSYPNDVVVIAGFGHIGWEGHPFAAEKQLVDAFVKAGRLRRLSQHGVPSTVCERPPLIR
ncbi:Urease operon accessory protein [Rhizobium laguerreae]|nr:Urease operon accessory protein [Rhizobium laguerreae]MBY3088325.1 Urease operon accessory protein [Rhizobium laguerreae]MBY3149306.1 Urease operon accessory protein [Rhizobium laguerreae]NKM32074.1 Urease operon accessory protein [Rhizobium laguerreae]